MDSGLQLKDLIDNLLTTAALIVGIVTFYVTFTKEKRKEREAQQRELEMARREQRVRVYTDYLKVVAGAGVHAGVSVLNCKRDILEGLAQGKSAPDTEAERMQIASHLGQLEMQNDFNNAHANIVTYGSPQVIARLSGYYDALELAGFDATDPTANHALLALIGAMRNDSYAEDYDLFIDHADNILGLKAQVRANKAAKAQTAAYGAP